MCHASKSFAGEVKSDSREIAATAVQLLPRVIGTEIAESRHVRYLPRDAPTRTLEKQADIQFLNFSQ